MNALRVYAQELRTQSETLKERASTIVRKVALDTEADAKQFAPVDTGNLKNSIQTVVTDGGLTAGVVATASYAAYVELGASGRKPRPFMGDATDRHAPMFRKAMAQLAEG